MNSYLKDALVILVLGVLMLGALTLFVLWLNWLEGLIA
jgi:hypothetical protein